MKKQLDLLRDAGTGKAPRPPQGLQAVGVVIKRPAPPPPGPHGGAQAIARKVRR